MGTKPLVPGIRSIKGTVSVNGNPAKEGQLIVANNSISTGKASEVTFALYGHADITPTTDATQSRSVVTHHHESPFFIGVDKSQPMLKTAPVINHRDYELTLLESLVGRQPPFATRSGYGSY